MKKQKWELLIRESLNFIIISTALAYMKLVFSSNPVYIIFFASSVYTLGNYLKETQKIIQNKIVTAIIFLICFGIEIAFAYFLYFR